MTEREPELDFFITEETSIFTDHALDSNPAKDLFEIRPKKIHTSDTCGFSESLLLTHEHGSEPLYYYVINIVFFWREFSDVCAKGNEWSARIKMAFYSRGKTSSAWLFKN